MLTDKIRALFQFIDFLDSNKDNYIKNVLPLVNEIAELSKEQSKLNPGQNYKDKQKYDEIQKVIDEKFPILLDKSTNTINARLIDLNIWSGDYGYNSIYNNNVAAACEITKSFTDADIKEILKYKQKYLGFRRETNTNFLSLAFMFGYLDNVLKILFDFFKDTEMNELEAIETKAIPINKHQYNDKMGTHTECRDKHYYALAEKYAELRSKYRVSELVTKEEKEQNHEIPWEVGDAVTQNPPIPNDPKEAQELFKNYYATIQFELQKYLFLGQYKVWSDVFIKEEVKKLEQWISETEKKGFGEGDASQNEYWKFKGAYYDGELMTWEQHHDTSTAAVVYGKYFLFYEWLKNELKTHTNPIQTELAPVQNNNDDNITLNQIALYYYLTDNTLNDTKAIEVCKELGFKQASGKTLMQHYRSYTSAHIEDIYFASPTDKAERNKKRKDFNKSLLLAKNDSERKVLSNAASKYEKEYQKVN